MIFEYLDFQWCNNRVTRNHNGPKTSSRANVKLLDFSLHPLHDSYGRMKIRPPREQPYARRVTQSCLWPAMKCPVR
ncbi:MAG TPA: hypothetical protein PLB35_11860, partial [Myxococcota bacterium]|nr:hypothetical protein [Myxococcota bacterium]